MQARSASLQLVTAAIAAVALSLSACQDPSKQRASNAGDETKGDQNKSDETEGDAKPSPAAEPAKQKSAGKDGSSGASGTKADGNKTDDPKSGGTDDKDDRDADDKDGKDGDGLSITDDTLTFGKKDEEPSTADTQTSKPKRARLIVTGIKRDDKNAALSLRLIVNGKPEAWRRIPWPAKGQKVEVADGCIKGKPNLFEIEATDNDGRTFHLPDPKLMVVAPSVSRPTIGFEPTDCDDGPLCQDDDIATVECEGSDVTIKQ